jgi:YesN/AraC family two-component response regulator
MKILIVDDEKEFLEFLKDRLIVKSHLVNTACDGKKALELIKSNIYDLVFLDHNMPGLTGLELLRYIKENDLKPKTVIITGYAEIDEFFVKGSGADEYLNKPVKIKDIDDIIDKYSKQNCEK